MSWIVKPVNIRSGAVAPGISCDSEKLDEAIVEAKSKSRLSDFANWDFSQYTKHIKAKRVKKIVYEEEI